MGIIERSGVITITGGSILVPITVRIARLMLRRITAAMVHIMEALQDSR